jgi:aerobic-type carbon monoxide dehydrogenase small subunit (CoxS/CutS family)
VLLDGVEIRSCITAVADVQGRSLTTPEGLPALYAQQKGLAQIPALHPLQQAFIDVQAPQCGYCYNGMTIKGSELLAMNPKPTEAQIRAHMEGHLCRCATYPRVIKAIQLASSRTGGDVR